MQEIVNHTFSKKVLQVKNGEPFYVEKEKKKCYFTLTHAAHETFEKLYGKSILKALSGKDIQELNNVQSGKKENLKKQLFTTILDKEFIKSLAAASYLDISDNNYQQSELTAQKFIEMDLLENGTNDPDFFKKMVEMVTACMPEVKNKNKSKGHRGSNKKK